MKERQKEGGGKGDLERKGGEESKENSPLELLR